VPSWFHLQGSAVVEDEPFDPSRLPVASVGI
jgi:hypothetical protein